MCVQVQECENIYGEMTVVLEFIVCVQCVSMSV